ncbi:MAG TPA: hypothetical protein VFY44_11085 [Thermoleophilaceae bacterium]|nr:hypothetical protein [Thermoleophilaceae bacterium]
MSDHLPTYLNDHLAGSTAGLELARRAAGSNEGTELGTLLSRFASEFEGERSSLKSVIEAVGSHPNPAKVAAAWVGEKAGRLKPNDQLTGYSALSRMVELEGLSIGIEGKRLLWRALAERTDPRLTSFDFTALAEQAQRQRDELEPFRLAAAASAFDADAQGAPATA